jgi:methyl-galactoside transport system substrate-binding protein
MKAKATVLAVLLALFALGGCSPNINRVAFLYYDEYDTFIYELRAEVERLLPGDVASEVYFAGNSQTMQNQQIIELANAGIKLIAINAVDRLACSTIAELCVKRGIDVIFFNREPLEDAMKGDKVFYVGAAAESLGKKQADMVVQLFSGNFSNGHYDKNKDGVIQLAIIKGEEGHKDAELRTDNCVSRLIDRGFDVEVLGIETADWNKTKGYDAMKRLYGQF